MITLLSIHTKALIFDCDGTLVDTTNLHYRAWKAALAQQGLILKRQWYLAHIGFSADELLGAYETEFQKPIDRLQLEAPRRRIFQTGLSSLFPIPQVYAIVRRYHGELPMTVASGGDRISVHATLEAAGLMSLFDSVVTVDDVGVGKPFPDLFLEAAHRMKVEPSHCLVFEDTDEGLEAAKRAGMKAEDVRQFMSTD